MRVPDIHRSARHSVLAPFLFLFLALLAGCGGESNGGVPGDGETAMSQTTGKIVDALHGSLLACNQNARAGDAVDDEGCSESGYGAQSGDVLACEPDGAQSGRCADEETARTSAPLQRVLYFSSDTLGQPRDVADALTDAGLEPSYLGANCDRGSPCYLRDPDQPSVRVAVVVAIKGLVNAHDDVSFDGSSEDQVVVVGISADE